MEACDKKRELGWRDTRVRRLRPDDDPVSYVMKKKENDLSGRLEKLKL